MSALREALDDSDGLYISNEHGRGYRLLGTTALSVESPSTLAARPLGLPANLGRVIGREASIEAVRASLATHRLVSVVGPGGIGKTTLALEVANSQKPDGRQPVAFVDLAALAGGDALPAFTAAAIGSFDSEAPASAEALADALSERDLLLVFDNCEHMATQVAALLEKLLERAPRLRVLATTREVLGLPQEKVHRLGGIAVPPPDQKLTLDEALDYSAVDLLAERAAALSDFVLADADVPAAVDICRRLDGIPLAIELAAGWISVIGLDDIARHLDGRLSEMPDGRRGAAPRHRTLDAMLDWSFELLSVAEQDLLLRLAVFRGSFTLSAAEAIAGGAATTSFAELLRRLGQLVTKSLVMVRPSVPETQYHLLETTRNYVWRRLSTRPELDAVSRIHARHVGDLLSRMEADGIVLPRPELLRRYGPLLADVRAALNWALGDTGDPTLAVEIIGGAVPMGLRYWQPDEFVAKLEQGLELARQLGPEAQRQTVRLSYQIGHILNQVAGDTSRLQATLELIQQARPDSPGLLPEQVMAEWVSAFTLAKYQDSLTKAEQLATLAADIGDEVMGLLADRVMAQSEHFLGRHDHAEQLARRVLESRFEHLPYSQIGHRVSMRIVLCRVSFLRNNIDAAEAIAAEGLVQARQLNAISVCQMLALGVLPLAMWQEDQKRTQELLRELRGVADEAGLAYWGKWAGDLQQMQQLPTQALPDFLERDEVSPKLADFAVTVDPQFYTRRVGRRFANGDVGWAGPEVLRAEARSPSADHRTSRRLLEQAISLAGVQGATAWQRRSEADLAAIEQVDRASPSDPV